MDLSRPHPEELVGVGGVEGLGVRVHEEGRPGEDGLEAALHHASPDEPSGVGQAWPLGQGGAGREED